MRQRLARLLALLVSMVLGILLLEGVARWHVGVPFTEKLPLVRVKADRDAGWVMVPGDVHYTYDKQVRLNHLGFRGRDIAPKRDREYRIVALGDSHIYGQGLADEDLITTVLERELNSTAGNCSFNVINMGVRAYSINNELAVLIKFGIPLNPDHVILFFYINDFQGVDIEKRYAAFSDKDWYMFDLSDKPTEQIIRSWRLRQVFRKSALLMWVHDLTMAIGSRNNIENRILRGVLDDEVKERIGFVKDSLEELRQLSREHNFSVTLAVLPVASQALNDYPNELYQSLLKQYAQEHSLDFVDLRQTLRDYYEESGSLPVTPFDGHYDAIGHRVFGMAMLEHLRAGSVCRERRD